MMRNHLTNEQLQMFVDGVMPKSEADIVENHLRDCAQCLRARTEFTRVDVALRNLPSEHLSGEFTRSVMASLHIVPHSPFLFRAVENLAYVFGMMIVLGVMLTVFVLSGVLSSAHVSQTESLLTTAGETVGQHFSTFTNSLTSMLQSYLPFFFGNGNLKIAIMGSIAVAGLVVLDKFLKRRMH